MFAQSSIDCPSSGVQYLTVVIRKSRLSLPPSKNVKMHDCRTSKKKEEEEEEQQQQQQQQGQGQGQEQEQEEEEEEQQQQQQQQQEQDEYLPWIL